MSTEEQNATVYLERTGRSTRGKRMTKLVDDELEADEEFWDQDAFKEVVEDAEYEAEEDVVDEFDSDFDEDEANAEEAAAEDEVERVKKKRLLPPGTKPFKKDKKKKVPMFKTKGLDVIEAAVASAIQSKSDEPSPIHSPAQQIQDVETIENDFEGEKIVRKSTRTAVVIRQAEREALRAAMQATTIKPVKRKREGERRITQEDMLLEAAQTEILNRQNLERMLAREEEVKQKAIVHKTVYSGPQIRFYSREGKNFLEFMGAVKEAQELFGQPKRCHKRALVCAVTGLRAKYVDPLTGLAYATKEAFKMIRERVDKEDYTQRETTPGKKFRSERSIPGRLSARKARRSILSPTTQGHLHGKPSHLEARGINIKASMREEAQRPHLPEAFSCEGAFMDLCSWPVHGSSSLQPFTKSVQSLLEGSEENSLHSHVGCDAASSLLQNLREPLWVEIPPPKEGPTEDDFSLDDLTSLNFGPILALQHGVESLRDEELDIADPLVGSFGPLDVLPMPLEFDAHVV